MSNPSDYELKLLRPLWRAQRLSAREIHDATSSETKWSYSATRKTLDRMAEKRLVAIEIVHGVKTFAAARPKLETVAGLIKRFARDVLDTDQPLPAATFVNSSMVDADEVQALQALLDELDKETDEV